MYSCGGEREIEVMFVSKAHVLNHSYFFTVQVVLIDSECKEQRKLTFSSRYHRCNTILYTCVLNKLLLNE